MKTLKNPNYRNYLFGRVISNFGDSLYSQLLIVYITLELSNSQTLLSVNNFLINLPALVILFFGPKLDAYANKKKLVIINELALFFSVAIFLLLFMIKGDSYLLILVIGIFYLLNSLKGINEFALQKVMVEEKDRISFIKLFRLTGRIFDSVADAGAVTLIKFIGYVPTIIIDLLSYIFSIFSFSRVGEVIQKNIDENNESLFHNIKEGFKHFFEAHFFSRLVLCDGILAGTNTLIKILLPIYLFQIDSFYLYPFFLVLNSIGWYIGTLYVEKVSQLFKNAKYLFIFDYAMNILFPLTIVLGLDIRIGLFLYFLGKIPQATTGVLYDKFSIASYKEEYISRVGTVISFFLTVMMLIFSLVPILFSGLDIVFSSSLFVSVSVIIIIYLTFVKNDVSLLDEKVED